jgi:hypothetical protein
MHQELVSRARWFVSPALLGAACLLMASTSPQCARTADNTLGLSTESRNNHAGGCREDCIAAAAQARVDERERFVAAIKACGDPQCRGQEAGMHASIMAQIAADQAACQGGCHNQGGGEGGD